MADLVEVIKKLGLSTKAAKIYLAALELGEASIQQMSNKSKLKRTTLYYIIDELIEAGVLIPTKTGKKTYYVPKRPATLLKNARENMLNFEESLKLLEDKMNSVNKKPRVYFLYGASGFKQAWDMILDTKENEYRIITEGINFLDYVKEKYILDEIIAKKKKSGIFSKQLIKASDYARQVVAKDSRENRISKFLPHMYKLPFTEVITESLVIFISPKFDNMIFVVEDGYFSHTRRSIFDTLWDSIH